jgi:hypothetical protein
MYFFSNLFIPALAVGINYCICKLFILESAKPQIHMHKPLRKYDSLPISRDSSTIFLTYGFFINCPIWVRDPYPEFFRIQFRIHRDIEKEHESSGVRDSAIKASAVSETPPNRHQRYRADAATKLSVKIISVSDTVDVVSAVSQTLLMQYQLFSDNARAVRDATASAVSPGITDTNKTKIIQVMNCQNVLSL